MNRLSCKGNDYSKNEIEMESESLSNRPLVDPLKPQQDVQKASWKHLTPTGRTKGS